MGEGTWEEYCEASARERRQAGIPDPQPLLDKEYKELQANLKSNERKSNTQTT